MMTRELTLLALLLTPLALGCSEDGSPGGDTGVSTESMTGNSTSTGDAETDESSEGEASSSSGGADLCGDCVASSCSEQTEACAEDEACGCWLECIDTADDSSECVTQCGDTPSTLEAVFMCTAEACADPCDF